jgi:predicted DNA-binding helix-hairpin-helix protein
MIIGATETTDAAILNQASSLYTRHRLRRVYYSAFSPIPDASRQLPLVAPPLVREHRLYQADWLMRFYGFHSGELTATASANLALDVDPKLAWALRNRHLFPVDMNRATRALLLRVPGLGVRTVDRLVEARRFTTLRLMDLARLRVPLKKVLPFVEAPDHNPRLAGLDDANLRARFAPPPEQLDLFAPARAESSVLSGEL